MSTRRVRIHCAPHPHTGPRPTSGWRADAGSRRFIPQPLPPQFCWQPLQRALPGRFRAMPLASRTNGKPRQRVRALIASQGALGRRVAAYPARESVRGRSNLKTLHWSVFPRQGAGRFSPQILIPDNTAPRHLPYTGLINPIAARQTHGVSDEGCHSLVLGRPADRDHRALLFRLLLGQGEWAVGRWPTPPTPLKSSTEPVPRSNRNADTAQAARHRCQTAHIIGKS